MSFNSTLEEYYKKFAELQEKLKQSEEQRLVLEKKFSEMVHAAEEEEQIHYKKLRSQYKRFLEEDRKRQERNEYIIRSLERVETRISTLSAKTERIDVLRRQYQRFLQRKVMSNSLEMTPSMVRSKSFVAEPRFRDRNFYNFPDKSTQTIDIQTPIYELPSMKKDLRHDRTNDDKIKILDDYLENVSSQRCRDLLNQENAASLYEKHTWNTSPYGKHQSSSPNNASAIADDIMQSIYSRYYNKNDATHLAPSENENPRSQTSEPSAFPNLTASETVEDSKKIKNDLSSNEKQEKVSFKLSDSSRGLFQDSGTDGYHKHETNNKDNTTPHQINAVQPKPNSNISEKCMSPTNLMHEKHPVSEASIVPHKNSEHVNIQPDTATPNVNLKVLKSSDLTIVAQNDHQNQNNVDQTDHNSDNVQGNNKNYKEFGEHHQTSDEMYYNRTQPVQYKEELQSQPDQYTNEPNNEYAPQNDDPSNKNDVNNAFNNVRAPDQTQYDVCEDEEQHVHQIQNVVNPEPHNTLDQTQHDQYAAQEQHYQRSGESDQIPYDQYSSEGQYYQQVGESDQTAQQIQNDEYNMQNGHGPSQKQYQLEQSGNYNQNDQMVHYKPKHDQNQGGTPVLYQSEQSGNYDQNNQKTRYNSELDQNQGGTSIQYQSEQSRNYDQTDPVVCYNSELDLNQGGALAQYQPEQSGNYDQNDQMVRYNSELDQNQGGAPAQYLPEQSGNYDQNEQMVRYNSELDQNQGDGPVQYQPEQSGNYDQNNQIVHYNPELDQNQGGDPVQYDENGQIVQYDQNQSIYYEEPSSNVGYDENGQPIQYDRPDQQVNYDENGQPIRYVGGDVFYDQNGQIVQPQYDENGQIIPQYDQNGHVMVLYDQNGQQYFGEYKTDNGQYLEGDQAQQQYYEYSENPVQYEQQPDPNQKVADEETKADQENGDGAVGGQARNVMEMLDTDTESAKHTVSKVSNDSDFDFT